MNFALDLDFCLKGVLALGHFLWQATVIALLVMGFAAMFRKSAAIKYAILVCGLLAMVACPVITFSLIDPANYRLDVAEMSISKQLAEMAPSTASKQIEANLPSPLGAVKPSSAELVADTYKPVAISLPESGSRAMVRAADKPQADRIQLMLLYSPYMMAGYILCAGLMLIRLLVSLCGGIKLRKDATVVHDAGILAAVTRQAEKLSMRTVPAIAYCRQIAVPMVIGIIKPIIMLPVSFATGLTTDQIEATLAHELAHIRRLDHLVNLLQRIIESVLFFHPAVWLISRRIRIERENCCDDLVVTVGHDRMSYAACLINLAERASSLGLLPGKLSVALAATDRPSKLRGRILRLTETSTQNRLTLSQARPVILITLILLAILGGYSIATQHDPPELTDYPIDAILDVPYLDGIVIDGRNDDWDDSAFMSELIETELISTDDFDARFSLAWDDRGLLVLVEVTDDLYVEDEERGRLWTKDSIELYVVNEPGGSECWQLVISPGMDADHPNVRWHLYDWRKDGELRQTELTALAARGKFADGYIIEALLPWENLGITPEMGREIAFNINVNDHDGNAGGIGANFHPLRGGDGDSYHTRPLRLSDMASQPAAAAWQGDYGQFENIALDDSWTSTAANLPPEQAIVIGNAKFRPDAEPGYISRTTLSNDGLIASPTFVVPYSDKRSAWDARLPAQFKTESYPIMTMTYRARNIRPTGAYVIYLWETTGRHRPEFYPIQSEDLITDGQIYQLRRDLRDYNFHGTMRGFSISVESGEFLPAKFELLELRFEADPNQPNAAVDNDDPLTIQVLDTEGNPVAGAHVTLDPEMANWARTGRTDTSGMVTIVPLRNWSTRHSATVSADGMADVKLSGLTAGRKHKTVLSEATMYGGRVVDSQGSPVPGTIVALAYPENIATSVGSRRINVQVASAMTGADGSWQINELPSNSPEILVSLYHPNLLPNSWHLPRQPDRADQMRSGNAELVVPDLSTLDGLVLDPDGEPADSAMVSLNPNFFATDTISTRTDTEGRFSFKGMTNGETRIVVQHGKFAPQEQVHYIHPGANTADFNLEEGYSIEGRVVDSAGNPIEGASLEAVHWHDRISLNALLQTDTEGYFAWHGAPADTVKYHIYKQGYNSVRQYEMYPDGGPYTITMEPRISIRGSVTDAATGEPIRNFEIHMMTHSAGGTPSLDRRSFTGGTYATELKSKGDYYSLAASATGYQSAVSRTISNDEASVTIDFQLTPVPAVNQPYIEPAAPDL